jgi:REP element-mobilizing transposase RayT
MIYALNIFFGHGVINQYILVLQKILQESKWKIDLFDIEMDTVHYTISALNNSIQSNIPLSH